MPYLELAILRSIQEGNFRRRSTAPPIMKDPTLVSLIERGLLRIHANGKTLLITEDGCGALECAEHELKQKKGGG